ncbi:hypothetical protein HPB50_020218 [Hyalomma asiaticum]|uniref:Uncharacterized protein n=1 Tax=Hyalomma asiaticum TaxID=266040 RepID=A0ACB7T8F1_HYAAI|nr:hypothetical protein HPB50_020218 [Hyalomma asiaticum]
MHERPRRTRQPLLLLVAEKKAKRGAVLQLVCEANPRPHQAIQAETSDECGGPAFVSPALGQLCANPIKDRHRNGKGWREETGGPTTPPSAEGETQLAIMETKADRRNGSLQRTFPGANIMDTTKYVCILFQSTKD